MNPFYTIEYQISIFYQRDIVRFCCKFTYTTTLKCAKANIWKVHNKLNLVLSNISNSSELQKEKTARLPQILSRLFTFMSFGRDIEPTVLGNPYKLA